MGPSMISLRAARDAADYAAFGNLCRAYVGWCRERYADIPWLVDEVFGYQSLDDELKVLSAKYGPPAGATWLAELDGVIVGGGAYRRLSDGICELKRLYVADAARGQGVGRRLTQALMDDATAQGFTVMQLDTADRLSEATALYAAMGFVTCPPYHVYPDKLMPYIVFMQTPL